MTKRGAKKSFGGSPPSEAKVKAEVVGSDGGLSGTQSLLLSPQVDRYEAARHPTKKETSSAGDLSLRHYHVVALHLAGHKPTKDLPEKPSICELTGYSPAMVHRILSSEGAVSLRQELMQYYEVSFEDLFPKVVEGIEALLNSEDLDSKEKGAKLWLKYKRKPMTPDEGIGAQGIPKISAEQVIFNILNKNV